MELKPLKTRMIKQNCYVSAYSYCPPIHDDNKYRKKQYNVIVRTTSPEGVKEEMQYIDYPITPEYVKSFADSCNYKNDPLANLNLPSSRPPLGDITGLQNILQKDNSQILADVERLRALIGSQQRQQEQKTKKDEKSEVVENAE